MAGPDHDDSKAAVTVTLHGTRGSLPVSGSEFAYYGGRTICFCLQTTDATGQPRTLLFDAGTGAHAAAESFTVEGIQTFDLFLSHSHYDHVIGLPMLDPLYDPDCAMRLWSGHLMPETGGEAILRDLMRPISFPITPDAFRARISYHDFLPGQRLQPYAGIEIATARLNHPGGSVGYRIEAAGRVVAIVTDTEHLPGEVDPAVAGLITGADLLLYDAHFTDEEMAAHKGWGHSSWQEALRLGQAYGVARTCLIHHSPCRKDAALQKIARQLPDGAFSGRDGQVIQL